MRSGTQAKCGGGGGRGPKRETSAGRCALCWGAKAERAGGIGGGLSGSAEGEAPSGSRRCGTCNPEARAGDCGRGLLSPKGEARGGLSKVEPAAHFSNKTIPKTANLQNGHFLAEPRRCFWRVTNTSWFNRSYQRNCFSPTMTPETLAVSKDNHRFVYVTGSQIALKKLTKH